MSQQSQSQRPLPDLVRDSRLTTSFLSGGITQHVTYSTSAHLGRRRRLRTEESWHRERELGSGTFGQVWLEKCIDGPKTGNLRAVKEVPKDPKVSLAGYSRELEAMAKFSHEKYVQCFVKCFGWYDTESMVFLAMEYFEAGDLQHYLRKPFPETEAKEIVSQLVEGLSYMHDNGFTHRDLKPANILVHHPGPNWWVKIGDFGISKRVEQENTALRTLIGTAGYLAPEIIGFAFTPPSVSFSYTSAVDMWALGELSFRLITERPAFPSPQDLGRCVMQGQPFPVSVLKASGASEDCCDFIVKSMTADPNRRLTARDANAHPWVTSSQHDEPTTTPGPSEEWHRPSSSSESAAVLPFEDRSKWSTGFQGTDGFQVPSQSSGSGSDAQQQISGPSSTSQLTQSQVFEATAQWTTDSQNWPLGNNVPSFTSTSTNDHTARSLDNSTQSQLEAQSSLSNQPILSLNPIESKPSETSSWVDSATARQSTVSHSEQFSPVSPRQGFKTIRDVLSRRKLSSRKSIGSDLSSMPFASEMTDAKQEEKDSKPQNPGPQTTLHPQPSQPSGGTKGRPKSKWRSWFRENAQGQAPNNDSELDLPTQSELEELKDSSHVWASDFEAATELLRQMYILDLELLATSTSTPAEVTRRNSMKVQSDAILAEVRRLVAEWDANKLWWTEEESYEMLQIVELLKEMNPLSILQS